MKRRRKYTAWLFLAPSLLLYLAFFVYPTIEALRISFYKWSGFSDDMDFVGLNNFIRLIRDTSFHAALKNTLVLLIIGGVGIFILAFLFSFLLNSGIRGKKIYRSIIFFPYIIAPVVHAIYWGLLVFSPRKGILNSLFKLLGMESLAEFAFLDHNHIFSSVLFVVIWINVGFYLIILLAGMDRIPAHLYEAARLEGANEGYIFFKITLPLVREVLTILLVFWGFIAIRMFDLLYAFGGLLPPREIWTNAIYLYIVGFGKRDPIFQLGYATAIGFFTLILIVVFTVIIRRLLRREIYEY